MQSGLQVLLDVLEVIARSSLISCSIDSLQCCRIHTLLGDVVMTYQDLSRPVMNSHDREKMPIITDQGMSMMSSHDRQFFLSRGVSRLVMHAVGNSRQHIEKLLVMNAHDMLVVTGLDRS